MEDHGTPAAPLQGTPGEGDVVGEARWPMAGAVLAAMVLTLLLPDDLRLGRAGRSRCSKASCW
jgi:hypothetical protein